MIYQYNNLTEKTPGNYDCLTTYFEFVNIYYWKYAEQCHKPSVSWCEQTQICRSFGDIYLHYFFRIHYSLGSLGELKAHVYADVISPFVILDFDFPIPIHCHFLVISKILKSCFIFNVLQYFRPADIHSHKFLSHNC